MLVKCASTCFLKVFPGSFDDCRILQNFGHENTNRMNDIFLKVFGGFGPKYQSLVCYCHKCIKKNPLGYFTKKMFGRYCAFRCAISLTLPAHWPPYTPS